MRGITRLSRRQNIVAEVVEEDQRVGIRIIVGIGSVRDALGSVHLQQIDRRHIYCHPGRRDFSRQSLHPRHRK